MVHIINLIDRIDTIRVNSVTDKEFEQAWGMNLDMKVKNAMGRWDELLEKAKNAIEENN